MSRYTPSHGHWALLLISLAQTGCGWILGLDEYSLRTSCPVAECGVFVALEGSDTNEGTKERPVRTVTRGIGIAEGASGIVHLCAQELPEAIEVPAGISLKGSLNCSGEWEYIGDLARTTLAPGPDMIPLRLLAGDAVTRLEDVDARAAAATVPGGSSIAMIAEGVSVEVVRCSLTSADAAPGDKGATPDDNIGSLDDPDDPSIKGKDGANACMGGAAGNPGGLGTANPLCNESTGGPGGTGGLGATSGSTGTDGSPSGASDQGKGGLGDSGGGCEPGGAGEHGALGVPGVGAMDLGTITISGYEGSAGAPGGRGALGQGGGGGGGAKGKIGCNGGSGGGGGAGGCGGYGGLGGRAGGASIAILSIKADVTLTDVKLTAGRGGNGGDGGDPQAGGAGGNGGKGGLLVAGVLPGCGGGSGGFGGFGGQGGGGRGGHSFGIAFTGKPPLKPATTIIALGAPGAGGLGDGMDGQGAPGEAADMIELPWGM